MMDLFNVEEEKIITESGKSVVGKKAIVRQDTGEILGVVSDKYKLVKHQELLNAMHSVIEGLGVEDQQLHLCKRGAVMFLKFYVPNLIWEPKVGDTVRFGLQVFNSYDCSLPVGVLLIGEVLRCSNGMSAPETMTSFFLKHYGNLDLGEVRRKANDVLYKVDKVKAKWDGYRKEEVTEEKVKKFLNASYGSRLREKMFNTYMETREGNTVWDLYQVLMYHSTHSLKARKGNEANIPLLRAGLENSVASRLNNYSWRN